MDFFEPYDGPQGVTPEGVPSLGDLATATYRQARLVDNVGNEGEARSRVYRNVNRIAKEKFGVDLPNPMTDWDRFDPDSGQRVRMRVPEKQMEAVKRLEDYHAAAFRRMQDQNPELFKAERLDKSIDELAGELARATESRGNRLDQSRDGVLPVLAKFWGGLQALPYDPMQVGSLMFGGAGRTVAQRIVSAAAAGGVTAAASYPLTMDWRETAGRRTGLGDFIEETAMGAAFGGAFQGAAEGVAAGARALRKGAAGPGQLAPNTTPVTASDDPVLRGARLVQEADDAMLAARPPSIDAEAHARALAETQRYLEEPRAPSPVIPERVPDGPAVVPDGRDGPDGAFAYEGRPVERRRLDARALGFDAEAMQYKSGGDRRGVRNDLASVDQWDNMAAQAVMSYEYADGRLVVADGHQRTGLAQRLLDEGRETSIAMDAFVFREADGWTPGQVRALAARRNLQQGTGDPIDTALALREMPAILDRTVRRGSDHMRTAQGLAKLDPETFGMVRAGVLPQSTGRVIGERLSDPLQQRAAADAVVRLNLKGEDTIAAFIDELKASAVRTDHVFDLFGDQMVQRSLAVEMAELKVKVADLLRADARAFAHVNKAADLVEARGNVIAREANAVAVDAARDAAGLLNTLSLDPGPLRDVLTRHAGRLAAGEKIAKVSRETAAEVAALVERDGAAALLPRAPATVDGMKAVTNLIDDPVGDAARRQADDVQRALLLQEPAASGKPSSAAETSNAGDNAAVGARERSDGPHGRSDQSPSLVDLVPGLDRGDVADGAKAAGDLRTRADVLDEMNRLDAENDLFKSCFGGNP